LSKLLVSVRFMLSDVMWCSYIRIGSIIIM